MAGAIALSPVAEAAHPAFGRPLRYFGDYELIDEIARGGMGVVYKARQISLNRTVAVKMILTGRRPMAVEVNRFRASTRAAAGLQHPNIVPIYEIGEQDGHDYFSMEFVEGPNLAQVVRDNPLPAARAANYVRTIAEAVHYAHERGILHRDLKPSNILLDPLDQPRVTDFGLAKNLSSDPELTEAGQVLGAPSFIPPEQAAGLTEEVGRHSDVYALGGILYYLLTGHPPFAAETPMATLARVMHHDPVAPRKLNANIPKNLENICLKCLEKRPQRRYPTAKDLADELGRFQRNEPIQASDPAGRANVGRPWYQWNSVIFGSFFGIVVLLIGGVMYWRTRLPETSARETAQSTGQTNKALPKADSNLQSAGGEATNQTQSGQLEIVNREIARLHPQADTSLPPVDSSVQPPIGNIHDAAKSGDLEKVRLLLKDNPNLVSSKDNDGDTPLHLAVLKSHKDVAELLLANKADVNAKSDNGGTPLHIAAYFGDKEIVQLLLASKADVNAKDNSGATPLHVTAQEGRKEAAELLLKSKADVNAKNNLDTMPLWFAAQEGHKDVAELLLTNKADVNAKASDGTTPLHAAARNGHKDVVILLLANNAQIDARENHGLTPLIDAAGFGQAGTVKLLLAKNSDVDAKTSNGLTSLHYAAYKGYKDVAELLLANKADVNAKSDKGDTPLRIAEESGHTDIADLLRQHGGQ
jgi:ankyrin repeat protein/tRNA A-37 threonylcarbamoyl transferase component Bud32